MKLIFITIVLYLNPSIMFSQYLDLPVDYIKIYSLPGFLKTKTPLSEDAIRKWRKLYDDKYLLYTATITNDSIIEKFTKLELFLYEDSFKEIDPRCVLDIYCGDLIYTISIYYLSNHLIGFSYLGKCYFVSKEFKRWLNSVGVY